MTDEQAWDDAEPFLIDLLMRFDEGTNFDLLDKQAGYQPVSQED